VLSTMGDWRDLPRHTAEFHACRSRFRQEARAFNRALEERDKTFTEFYGIRPPGFHTLDGCPDPPFCPNPFHRDGEEAP